MKNIYKIPLFPLQTVLMPGYPLPIHIFEEKYKLLVDFCILNNSEFGVVFVRGNRIQRIGCTAKIIQVYNQYDDGRRDIITLGKNRFKILNISEDELYLTGSVEYFDDDLQEETDKMFFDSKKAIEILQDLGKLKIDNTLLKYIGQLNLKIISFVISSIGGFSNSEKQKFIEMTSTSQRLEKTVEILDNYYQRVNSSVVN